MLNNKNEVKIHEREIVVSNGEKMSYVQLGDINSKDAIVIIHGSSLNADVMIPYGKLYAKDGYNVVLVDLPGHYGDISEPKNTLGELGDSVAGLISQLKKEKKLPQKSEVHGWSLGGSVALDVASRYNELVKSVGIIDSASNFHGIEFPVVTDEDKVAIITAILNTLKSEVISQDIMDNLLADLPFTLACAKAINSDFAIDHVLNIDDKLQDITVPVYDFYGSVDTLTTLDKQKEMMKSLKRGKLFVAEGYGHMAVMEDPQCVYNAFKELKDK